MAKRQITTQAIAVRDGANEEEIKAFAKEQGWSLGFASLYLRLRRINQSVKELQAARSPQEMARFMNERHIRTRR